MTQEDVLQGITIGVDAMDAQHQMLLEIGEHFRCTLREGAGDASDQLETTLNVLVTYARFHLNAEEDFMREIGYPGIRDHIKSHHKLVSRLRTQVSDYRAGTLAAESLGDFIQEWIVQHVLQEDLKYADFSRTRCRAAE